MSFEEQPIIFSCGAEHLVGVLAVPAQPRELAVLIVVGGPQYRAGSHRQFVQLARRLAAEGFPSLRFDVRGMGDSSGAQRDFESLSADIGAALDAVFRARPEVKHVVLWGLCDGASAALLYLDQTHDARVLGVAMLNPWVRSAASLARTQIRHYYLDRLRQPSFWRKLLTGRVAGAALRDLMRKFSAARVSTAPAAAASYQERMSQGWLWHDGPKLLALSERDYTAKEFIEFTLRDPSWQRALRDRACSRHELAGADHTLSDSAHRLAMESTTLAWLLDIAPPGHRTQRGSP